MNFIVIKLKKILLIFNKKMYFIFKKALLDNNIGIWI